MRAAWILSLALVAHARAADACTCGISASMLGLPDPRASAPPSTHAWVRLHRALLSEALCPTLRGDPATAADPGGLRACFREPRFVLRQAYATGQQEPAPLPTHTRVHTSGVWALVELIPEQPLLAGERYEVWWEEPDHIIEPRVVTTFRAAGPPDRTPPSWDGPAGVSLSVRDRRPGRIIDPCGSPERLVKITGPHASDAVGGFFNLYMAWFSDLPRVDDRRPPDAFFLGPELLGSDPSRNPPAGLLEAPFFLAEQKTLLDLEGCFDHKVQLPRGAVRAVGLKAVDLSGNSTQLIEAPIPGATR